MTKIQEKKLLKEYTDAVRAHNCVAEYQEGSGVDQAEELMYCDGEINAITRVLKILKIKTPY